MEVEVSMKSRLEAEEDPMELLLSIEKSVSVESSLLCEAFRETRF